MLDISAKRHEKANAQATKRDVAWFKCHPDRNFRVRRTMPFESSNPDDEGGFTIVRREHRATTRVFVRAKAKEALPNNEGFLELLWNEIATESSSPKSLTPERHRELLIAAGLWDEAPHD